jgi:hypothetical protein
VSGIPVIIIKFGKLLGCHTTFKFITRMPHNFITIYPHATQLEAIQNLNPDTLLALSVLS